MKTWLAILFLAGLAVLPLHAVDYLISHAPNNQQWTSQIYFRTDLPETEIVIEGYQLGEKGAGSLAWTSDSLLKSNPNALITPAEFDALIAGRGYDFLIIRASKELGEGKVNFAEANVAHSTTVQKFDTYLNSANFNNLSVSETLFAGIAFVVANPQETGVVLRYRLSDQDGNILAERIFDGAGEVINARYTKVLALAQDLFPGTAIPANSRINVAASGGGLIVNGILLQGSPKTMYGGEAESVTAEITFSKQVSRIFQASCQNCHHSAGSAPFPLTTYSEVRPLRSEITKQVAQGKMPPWKPDPACANFKFDNSLSSADRELVLAWIRDGAPEGDPAHLPQPLTFPENVWQLGVPDLVVSYSEPVSFAPGPDQYICLPVELHNAEPIYLQALELLPDNLNVVHHIVLYASNDNEAIGRDQISAEPGYLCFGGAGVDNQRIVGAWAPGSPQLAFPSDVGMTLKPNTTLIFQIHYSAELGITEPEMDQSQIGLYFTEVPREKELQLVFLGNDEFTIPPGDSNYLVADNLHLPISLDLYMIFPHMHLLGRAIGMEVTMPNGVQECLVSISDWDFDWQGFYYYQQPIHIPPGSVLNFFGLYDNSTDNPNNPNSPPQPVSFGEDTKDEMLIFVVGVVAPISLDFKNPLKFDTDPR